MNRSRFRGVFTALVTPFRPGGELDEDAFQRLVERQIGGGVHGLVPVGTTGETSTLSHEEHRRVVELCVQTAAGRVPVIAGAGSNSTAEAIELAHHAREIGADAVLAVTPYYNLAEPWSGLYRHSAGGRRGGRHSGSRVYNVPSRTSIDISNETLQRLERAASSASSASRTRPATCRAPACSG